MITNKLRFVSGEQTLAERKKDLRAYMKEKRGENENRDGKEAQMLRNVLADETGLLDGKKRRWFVYLSFSSEARTDELIERLIADGQKVYCPRVDGDEMFAVPFGDDCTLSRFGVREPVGEPYLGEMDIAIVPMLAVDRQGNRLGYGGGYYDKWLALHPECKRVAFVFDIQLVKQVPSEPTDEKMDIIVTDKQVCFTAAREKK